MKKKIAAIDIGTTKVCTIMGTCDSTGAFRCLGVGICPSHGIGKALVTDTNSARDSIRESIRKAEVMAGYKLDSAYIGVTGRHINAINSKSTIAISRSDMTVRAEDVKRAKDLAMSVKIPPEQKIIHVVPRSYKLDGFEVKDPVGMNSSELEVEIHLITASIASVQNLIKVVKGLGVKIEDLILEPLASAEAVLKEEEKAAGVLIADIGGGTTDIAVIKDGSIYHTSVLPAAGHQMTTDIVAGLGLSYDLAEEMKKKFGTLIPPDENADPDELVGENGHSVNFRILCEVLQARVEEIIRLVMLELPGDKHAELIPAGIVLTGGCASIPGIIEVAEKLTRLPARVGLPSKLDGVRSDYLINPAYATSVGMILWSMKNRGTSTWFGKNRGLRGFLSQLFKIFR